MRLEIKSREDWAMFVARLDNYSCSINELVVGLEPTKAPGTFSAVHSRECLLIEPAFDVETEELVGYTGRILDNYFFDSANRGKNDGTVWLSAFYDALVKWFGCSFMVVDLFGRHTSLLKPFETVQERSLV